MPQLLRRNNQAVKTWSVTTSENKTHIPEAQVKES